MLCYAAFQIQNKISIAKSGLKSFIHFVYLKYCSFAKMKPIELIAYKM